MEDLVHKILIMLVCHFILERVEINQHITYSIPE